MLFGKSKTGDKSDKNRPIAQARLQSGPTRAAADDLLTERLFEDGPPSADPIESDDLILDIEPDPGVSPPRPAPPAANAAPLEPKAPKRGWFGRAPKAAASVPRAPIEAPSPKPATSLAIEPDDLIFEEGLSPQPTPVAKPGVEKSPVKKPQEKPRRSWTSLFARKPAAPRMAKPSVAPGQGEPWTAKKPEKPKKDSQLVIQAAPSAPKAEPKKNAKRTKAPTDPYLLLDIGGPTPSLWQVMPAGLETRDAIPPAALAISFAAADLRFAVEGTLTGRKAEALVLESTGEPVFLLNRSKDLGTVYACAQLRFSGTQFRAGPGALLLDTLYAKDAIAGQSAIVGFQLKDAADKDAIVILYYRAPSGELSAPQISLYPDDLEFVLSQFATQHQVRPDSKLTLFDNAALREAASGLAAYPNQPMFGALTREAVWKGAMAASMLGALVSGAWAGYLYHHTTLAELELAGSKSHTQRLNTQTKTLLEGSSAALAKGLSLQLESDLTRSKQLWVPGAKVKMTVDGSQADYQVVLPLTLKIPGHPLAELTPLSVVEQLRTQSPPAGCQRKDFNFSGALNEVSLTIHCEDPVSRLARYSGR